MYCRIDDVPNCQFYFSYHFPSELSEYVFLGVMFSRIVFLLLKMLMKLRKKSTKHILCR